MIIAVDTNVFLDVLRPNPAFVTSSLELLKRSAGEGALTICSVVWAELAANFARRDELEAFLRSVPASLEPFTPKALHRAGQAWVAYRKAGGKMERILPDFMIGAHAGSQAAKLLSRDRGFYRSYFPELEVIER
jgi:predicted nucleic acid-binding protein